MANPGHGSDGGVKEGPAGSEPNGAKDAHSISYRRKIVVLLVDARPWTREAVALALESSGRDIRVARFSNVADLSHADPGDSHALVLLSVTGAELANGRLRGAVATARSLRPSLPVAALSDSAHPNDILDAIRDGINGYIPMSLGVRIVAETIRFIAAGGTYGPGELLLPDLDAADSRHSLSEAPSNEATTPPGNKAAGVTAVVDSLTPRERDVLARLGHGRSNKHIARELGVSEATVKVHVRHIMGKLGASNRTQAALLSDILKKDAS
jgi:DNA-binding NarL/FixJ family response regulator